MKNIILIGLPGSGKTTLGKELANKLSLNFIDIDSVIENRSEKKIEDIFNSVGEQGFRELETEAVKVTAKEQGMVIACGGGIVLKEINMDLLSEKGIIVYINRSIESILASIDSEFRPLLKDNPSKIYKLNEERSSLYEEYADFIVGRSNDYEETLKELINIFDLSKSEKNFGVIGDPIEHSLSPDIHLPVLNKILKNVSYDRHRVPKDILSKWMEEKELDGFNVTMPNKVEIIPLLDSIDDEAVVLGSVNTVVKKDGHMHGYNTDGLGFAIALKEKGRSFKNKKVTILGVGGAGRSLAIKAAKEGAKKIDIFARRQEPALEIIKRIEKDFGIECKWRNFLINDKLDTDIVINATPLGMTGIKDDFENFGFLDNLDEVLLCDLIYSPTKTNLLKEGEKRGLKTMGGLPMLIYQALYADQYFLGAELSFKKAYKRAYNNLIGKVDIL